MDSENGIIRSSPLRLALTAAALAAMSDAFLVAWLWPQSGPARPAYVFIALEIGFWGLAGLLGIVLSARPRSRYLSFVTWASIGGLAAATFHSALSLIYFTLPIMLLFAFAAVRVGRREAKVRLLGVVLVGVVGVALSVVGSQYMPH
jgi:hypothetical protein